MIVGKAFSIILSGLDAVIGRGDNLEWVPSLLWLDHWRTSFSNYPRCWWYLMLSLLRVHIRGPSWRVRARNVGNYCKPIMSGGGNWTELEVEVCRQEPAWWVKVCEVRAYKATKDCVGIARLLIDYLSLDSRSSEERIGNSRSGGATSPNGILSLCSTPLISPT